MRVVRAAQLAGLLALALAAAGCANKPDRSGPGGRRHCAARQPAGFRGQRRRSGFLRDPIRPSSRRNRSRRSRSRRNGCSNYNQYTFTIEGHADERGTREYNIALGDRRAQTVRDYLISRGIPAQRMRTMAYGKERPVAVCNDISCWSQNRRAVTVLNTSS